jgi:hypothetical protein
MENMKYEKHEGQLVDGGKDISRNGYEYNTMKNSYRVGLEWVIETTQTNAEQAKKDLKDTRIFEKTFAALIAA